MVRRAAETSSPPHVHSRLGEVQQRMLADRFPTPLPCSLTPPKTAYVDRLPAGSPAYARVYKATRAPQRREDQAQRTDVLGIFPNDASILLLVTAVVVEDHDEWAVASSGYLSEDSMAKLYAGRDEPVAADCPWPSPLDTVDVEPLKPASAYTTPRAGSSTRCDLAFTQRLSFASARPATAAGSDGAGGSSSVPNESTSTAAGTGPGFPGASMPWSTAADSRASVSSNLA